jgi:hypothetical protein
MHIPLVADKPGNGCSQQYDYKGDVKEKHHDLLPLEELLFDHDPGHIDPDQQEQQFKPMGTVNHSPCSLGAIRTLYKRGQRQDNDQKNKEHPHEWHAYQKR